MERRTLLCLAGGLAGVLIGDEGCFVLGAWCSETSRHCIAVGCPIVGSWSCRYHYGSER